MSIILPILNNLDPHALPECTHEFTGIIDQTKSQVMSIRPSDSSASSLKADGEKSRSDWAQPVQRSVTVTVVDFPLTVTRAGQREVHRRKGEGEK